MTTSPPSRSRTWPACSASRWSLSSDLAMKRSSQSGHWAVSVTVVLLQLVEPDGRPLEQEVARGQAPVEGVAQLLLAEEHPGQRDVDLGHDRSEEHTSELPSLMRTSYAV